MSIIKVSDAPAGSIIQLVWSSYGENFTGDYYKIEGSVISGNRIKAYKRFSQGFAYIYGGNDCVIVDWNDDLMSKF